MGEFKDQKNTEYDCHCDLQGQKAPFPCQGKLIGHYIIGGPIDTGTRNQRKDSRDEKNGDRAAFAYSQKP